MEEFLNSPGEELNMSTHKQQIEQLSQALVDLKKEITDSYIIKLEKTAQENKSKINVIQNQIQKISNDLEELKQYNKNQAIKSPEELNQELQILKREEYMCTQKLNSANQKLENRKKSHNHLDFIGANPVALDQQRYQKILFNPTDFLVCEKTDGMRYLMIICRDGNIYLTGRLIKGDQFRQYNFFKLAQKIPQQVLDLFPKDLFIIQLLDGELVIDVINGKEYINYLVFDNLIHFGKQSILNKDNNYIKPYHFNDRLKCAEQFIMLLHHYGDISGIQIILKDFFEVKPENLEYIYNQYKAYLPHENDGLIFTKIKSTYKPGTDESILKWKPVEQYTLDCLLVLSEDKKSDIVELYLINEQKQDSLVLFDLMEANQEQQKIIKESIKTKYELSGGVQHVKGAICEIKLNQVDYYNENLHKKYKEVSVDNTDALKSFLQSCVWITKSDIQDLDQQYSLQKKMFFMIKEVRMKFNSQYTWEIKKVRQDKHSPNACKVAVSFLNSLNNNLGIEQLIELLRERERRFQEEMAQYDHGGKKVKVQ